MLGQRQIEIVAAEDQVVADGHAVELHLAAFAAADANQREIGRAAADVADQDFLAGRDLPLPVVGVGIDPGVESGLRLLDQHHPRQSGQGGRLDGQLAGHLVERGREGSARSPVRPADDAESGGSRRRGRGPDSGH